MPVNLILGTDDDHLPGTNRRASSTPGMGEMVWDANGTASAGETLIALLWDAPDLAARDILIL